MALLSKNKNLTTSYQTIHTGTAGNQTAAHTISLTNNTASQVTFDLTFYSAADAATYQLATLQPIGAYKTYTWPKPINMAAGDFIQAKASANSAVVTNISYYESSTTVSGFTLRGVWSSAVAYTINDIVFYNGVSYAALQAGTNQTPNTATTYWQVFSSLGYTGSQGVIGFTGSVGFVGSQGVGFTGSQGVIGFTGSKGDIGFTGSKGDIGFTGSSGAFAAVGFTGSQGTTGFTGSAGLTGATGTTGFTGSRGVPGVSGSGGGVFTIWGERNGNLAGGEYFGFGNGSNSADAGVVIYEDCILDSVTVNAATVFTAAATFQVYVNSIATGITLIVSGNEGVLTGTNYSIYSGDRVTFKCESGTGGTVVSVALWFHTNGAKGYTGSKGDVGFTGSTGFTGSRGDVGFTGSRGLQGDVGFTGSKGDIGYTGSKGDIGFTGSVGFVGSQGVIGFTGSQGNIGFTGSQGVIGFTGSVGFVGSQGYTGSQGAVVYTSSSTPPVSPVVSQIWIDSNTGIQYFYYDDGNTSQWIELGNSGPRGFTGSQGNIGFTGSQGVGFTGSQGVIGFTGSQGDVGFTGSQGVGFTGSQGVIGFTGSVGFTGSQGVGFTGSQGVIGFTGSQGVIGFTGSVGFVGSQGDIGFTGSQGVIGFTGSVGFVGSQGVIGFTGSVGFVGSQGVIGFTGSQGDIGFTGSQGVIGFTGSAANILNGVINFSEVVTPLTGATGVVVHNFALSEVFYHTSPASNFTANFTNVPTTSNAAIGIAILVAQGATPYLPNAVQIDGSAQTILWQGGSAASANANKTDVFVFNLIRLTSSWVVLGSGTTHG